MVHPRVFARRLLWAAALSLFSHASWACGPYSVGLYEFGALLYRAGSEDMRGIDKDLIDALARRSGCVLQTRVESRSRIWQQLGNGTLDITVSGIPTPEREHFAVFLPYLSTRNHTLIGRSLAASAGSPAQFLADPSLRVAAVRSFKYGPRIDGWLAQLRTQGRVDEVADFPTAFKVLMAGRVAMVFAHPMVIEPWRKQALSEHVLLDWAPEDTITAGLVLSRSRVTAADQLLLRRQLDGMLADGEFDQILRHHLGADMARQVRYEANRNSRSP